MLSKICVGGNNLQGNISCHCIKHVENHWFQKTAKVLVPLHRFCLEGYVIHQLWKAFTSWIDRQMQNHVVFLIELLLSPR